MKGNTMRKRFTVTDLRAIVNAANERNPLPSPNGYGNLNRYYLSQAYGGYAVHELAPGSTGHRDITYGHTSAREAANKFHAYLVSIM